MNKKILLFLKCFLIIITVQCSPVPKLNVGFEQLTSYEIIEVSKDKFKGMRSYGIYQKDTISTLSEIIEGKPLVVIECAKNRFSNNEKISIAITLANFSKSEIVVPIPPLSYDFLGTMQSESAYIPLGRYSKQPIDENDVKLNVRKQITLTSGYGIRIYIGDIIKNFKPFDSKDIKLSTGKYLINLHYLNKQFVNENSQKPTNAQEIHYTKKVGYFKSIYPTSNTLEIFVE